MKIDNKVDQHAVKGFSKRFLSLLDRSGVPQKNRVAHCAKRFGVVHNTFKGWCTADKTPKSYMALLAIVSELLKSTAGNYRDHAVTAWLLAGEDVPNPFEDGANTLKMLEIFLQVVDLSRTKGIEFESLDRQARELILEKTRNAVTSSDAPSIDTDPSCSKSSMSSPASVEPTVHSAGANG